MFVRDCLWLQAKPIVKLVKHLDENVQVIVNLLVQTLSRRELHRVKEAVDAVDGIGALLPTLRSTAETAKPKHPNNDKKNAAPSEDANGASGASAAAAEDVEEDLLSRHTWEQLGVWCQSLAIDIGLVLWVDYSNQEQAVAWKRVIASTQAPPTITRTNSG